MVEQKRGQRGAVMPSPVVLLSVLAIVMAAVAFIATRGDAPEEREITPTAQGSATATEPTETETVKKRKPVDRSKFDVYIYNNTSITGLAADTLARAEEIGWNGLGTSDWAGTVPTSTVYFPDGMKRAAKKLALDLGIDRVASADADSDLGDDYLTVILTGEL